MIKLKKILFKIWFLLFLIPFILAFIAKNNQDKIIVNNNFSKSPENIYDSINLFTEVIFNVQKYYYNDIPISTLIRYAVKGIFDNLDPYSSYLNNEDNASLINTTRGEFSGVGIQIIKNESQEAEVVGVLYDTPAYKGGILAGDIIKSINNIELTNLDIKYISKLLQGNVGSKIKLILYRGKKSYSLNLIREKIRPIVVMGKMYDDIAYIKINSFNERSNKELLKLLNSFSRKSNLEGLILDLRDNPGGLLDQGIMVADNFLPKNSVIVSVESKYSKEIYYAKHKDKLKGKPIVVLINKNSASAAEIVAGALKDNNRAIIVGNKSYGKGLIQSIIPLSKIGEEIKLTTGEYYIPSGVSINKYGIQPNIYVFSNGTLCNKCSKKSLQKYQQLEDDTLYDILNDSQNSYIDYQLQYALKIIKRYKINL